MPLEDVTPLREAEVSSDVRSRLRRLSALELASELEDERALRMDCMV